MAKTHRTHEEATVEMFRKDPELAADYLNSVLEDGDETDLMLALRTLSKTFGGVQEVARQADVNAHTLYRTLSEKGNPELKTLSAILKAEFMSWVTTTEVIDKAELRARISLSTTAVTTGSKPAEGSS